MAVSIPQPKDLETAMRLYYSKSELNTADIKELFGKICNSKISAMKMLVKDKMREKDIASFSAHGVNTKLAYLMWGIDINDVEDRYKKLKKLFA
ncbi:MAG: hypothetical protein VB118_04680 [Oscillospiraceae bacterium]|nr:hypothetical protein [Oscillospiraceae bacterium]